MPPTVEDAACGEMLREACEGLLARGMSPDQLRDSMLGGAIGMALRSGWSRADIERVTREYVDVLSRMTTATASKA